MDIIIDAGHGGSDPGAVYNGRREKDDNLEIALAVGELLQENGVNVIYTRTDDVYDSPIRKAQIANESNGDYFISIHRNSSATPNQYNGVQTLVYDNNGIKAELANNINSALANAGFQNLGVSVRKDLAVLRRTQMPSVLVEVGFINSSTDNTILDNNMNEIAQAIANAILETVGNGTYTNITPGQTGNAKYRIQTGLFTREENANLLSGRLASLGLPVQVVRKGDYYAVEVGSFNTISDAQALENDLKLMGYDTLILQ